MGSSATGSICFGVAFEDEEHEFPWGRGEHDDWWFKQSGGEDACPIKHSQIFDERGEWLGGKETDALGELWEQRHVFRKQWDAAHPISFEVVPTYSFDFDYCTLAVPGTVICSGEESKPFIPSELAAKVDDAKVAEFKQFFKDHNIEMPGEPQWYLGSCYG